MSSPDSQPPDIAAAWDKYWQGTTGAGAYASGGAQHPAFTEFWVEILEALRDSGELEAIADIAGGNGAIPGLVERIVPDALSRLTSVDVSPGAIAGLRQRFPQVTGLVSDARRIPLDSGSFALVTSQFGVEYAGDAAVFEAARLVAPGGRLCLLLHVQGGAVHAECGASLAAIRRMQRVAFIHKAIRLFEAGFSARRGGSRSTYEAAARQMQPAFLAMQKLLDKFGPGVAGGTVRKLASDVQQIHARLGHYEPRDVLAWLRRMDGELDAYAGRMASMQQAALGRGRFDRLVAGLDERGVVAGRAGLLEDRNGSALAWAYSGERRRR